jgi:hypothetical protein
MKYYCEDCKGTSDSDQCENPDCPNQPCCGKPLEECHCNDKPVLNFEEWYAQHEQQINIELAETGADREMDFDVESEFNVRYQKFLNG